MKGSQHKAKQHMACIIFWVQFCLVHGLQTIQSATKYKAGGSKWFCNMEGTSSLIQARTSFALFILFSSPCSTTYERDQCSFQNYADLLW